MCLLEPCFNNATCVQENNGRRCICLEGFSGKLCDQIFININKTNKNRTGEISSYKVSLVNLYLLMTIQQNNNKNTNKPFYGTNIYFLKNRC